MQLATRLLLPGLRSQRHVSPASSGILKKGAARFLDALLREAFAFLSFIQTVAGIHDGPYRSDERNAIDAPA